MRSMSNTKELIGQNLSRLRKSRGWTQTYLGELVGVEPSSVQRWEYGASAPDADNLDKLTEIFNVPHSALFLSEEKEKPSLHESIKVVCLELGYDPRPLKKKLSRANVGPDLSHVPETIIEKLSNFHGRWDLLETSIKALSESGISNSDKDKKKQTGND